MANQYSFNNSNQPTWIIGASCIALIALILFQVNWLQHSRKLIEEQFEQRVTMALCNTVDAMVQEGYASPLIETTCNAPTKLDCAEDDCIFRGVDQVALGNMLGQNLKRCGIDYRFQFEIKPQNEAPQPASTYCSSIQPLTQQEDIIAIQFEGKKAYVIEQMGFMTGTSILILLLVCGLFGMTMIKLLQQRKLYTVSVDFFNNMAHEFRTPLTNIKLALNLLQRKEEQLHSNRYLGVIQSESARLLDQVERLLQVAKLEQGDYQLEKDWFDLAALLNKITQDLQIQAQQKGGHIEPIYCPELSIPILADKLHLSNAFRNLIDNALKYCVNSPIVKINISTNSEYALLTFSDNGIGISPNQKQLLFEKFHRGQSTDTQSVRGFGLGLSYVKTIIQLHGGDIQLNSELGTGSTFKLFLPLKATCS